MKSFPVQVVVDKAAPLNLCYMAAFLGRRKVIEQIFRILDYGKKKVCYLSKKLVYYG